LSELERRRRLYRAVRLIPGAVSIPVGEKEKNLASEASEEPLEAGRGSEAEEPSLSEKEIQELRKQKEELEKKVRELGSRAESSSRRVLDVEEMMRKREEELQRQEKTLRQELAETLEKERQSARSEGLEEGRTKGYEEGRQKALDEAQRLYAERFDAQVNLLEGIYKKIEEQLEALAEGNQHRLIRMWETVLRNLLRREVHLNEATAMEILRSVLQRLTDRDRIVVYLHPLDLEMVTNQQEEFADILRGIQHVEFLQDPQVDRGSCLVESSMGIYDARWRTQLEQVAEEVNQVLLDERAPEETKNEHTE
jgi:flagellar assembly protein FliH